MNVRDLITQDRIVFNEAIATKEGLLTAAAQLFAREGIADDVQDMYDALQAREAEAQTGIEDGFGVPHAKSSHVAKPALAFFHTAKIADYVGLDDSNIECSFVIVCPENGGDVHLDVLSSLVRRLVDEDFRNAMRGAKSADEVLALL